ncbi:MAG: tripeptide aminopeptidase PepT [Paludibacteraceae bacterium]|nr:tripeptide aminopeptidase PepT [Paludibacteraceae bacterium]
MKTKAFLILIACICSVSCMATQKINHFTISQQDMLNRLLEYLVIESGSEEVPQGYPMTEGQRQMAEKLSADAKSLKAQVTLTEWGYVYVSIPSNIKREVPTIGVSCHLDYTPEAPGKGIKPKVIKYQGGVIELGHGIIDPATPKGADLPNLIGKTIIHSDGTTLLGGDDKNGCAIVMSVIETVQKKGFKHGPLQFVFCPNEDIGLAALKIDTTYFNPDILIDVDAGGGKQVAVSNFTAREIVVRFVGQDAHPSEAKKQHLGDALAAASTFIARVPLQYRPENTEGKQGYIHPWNMERTDDKLTYTVSTRIRYFDQKEGEEFDKIIRDNILYVQQSFPYVTTKVTRDILQYDNVEYTMHPQSISLLKKAAERCGIELSLEDLRAGTTASMFCAKGLRGGLSIFSGQHNEHSVQEYSVLEEMYDAYILLLTMIDEITIK